MIRLQGFYTSKYIFDKVFSSFKKKEKQQKETLLMLFLGWSTSSLLQFCKVQHPMLFAIFTPRWR